MKLRDIQNRVRMIREHDIQDLQDFHQMKVIRDSKKNAIDSLSRKITHLLTTGQWPLALLSSPPKKTLHSKSPSQVTRYSPKKPHGERQDMNGEAQIDNQVSSPTINSSRGNSQSRIKSQRRSQPSQKMSNGNEDDQDSRKFVNIVSNNKFGVNLNSDKYREAARENLLKRKNYDPKTSAQQNPTNFKNAEPLYLKHL
jgi:hypothetical protein